MLHYLVNFIRISYILRESINLNIEDKTFLNFRLKIYRETITNINDRFRAVNRLNEERRKYNILIVLRVQHSHTVLELLTLTKKAV